LYWFSHIEVNNCYNIKLLSLQFKLQNCTSRAHPASHKELSVMMDDYVKMGSREWECNLGEITCTCDSL